MRKQQADWKIGIKYCPQHHQNHLDETRCTTCHYEFVSTPREFSIEKPRPNSSRRYVLITLMASVAVFLVLVFTGIRSPSDVVPGNAQDELKEQINALERKYASLERKYQTIERHLETQDNRIDHIEKSVFRPVTPVLIVQAERANVREGPGTEYRILGTVRSGQIIEGPFLQKSGWYRFCCGQQGEYGWIAGNLVQLQEPD